MRAPARVGELPSRSTELLNVNPAPLVDENLFPLRSARCRDDEPDQQPQAARQEAQNAMEDVVHRLPRLHPLAPPLLAYVLLAARWGRPARRPALQTLPTFC